MCPKGHEVSDGLAFCPTCETDRATGAEEPSEGDGPASTSDATYYKRLVVLGVILLVGAGVFIWASERSGPEWDASVEHAIAYVCGDITPADVARADQHLRPTVPGEFATDVPAWEDYYEPEIQYRIEGRAFVASTRRGTYLGNTHAVAGWSVTCVDNPGPLWVESPDGGSSHWDPRNGEVVKASEVDRYDLVKLYESGDLAESFDWQPSNE